VRGRIRRAIRLAGDVQDLAVENVLVGRGERRALGSDGLSEERGGERGEEREETVAHG
jgi:hypothetical protein